MTLRFFRRKSSGEEAEEPMPEEKGEDAKSSRKSTTRRRTSTSRSSRSRKSSTAKSEPSKSSSPSTSKTSTGRTRRGRRGGAARKSAASQAKAEPTPERAPAPVIPIREEEHTLEGLIVRQEQTLDRQLELLKGLQGTMSAIENRLAGITPLAEQPRVGIFVDVPNVMYAAQRLRVTLDFKKVLDFLLKGRELVRASAYAPISDDPKERLETQRFVQPFVDLGYRVVTKPHKRYADGSMKANFDVELAIDVLTMSDRLDIVTLVSGDGDFRRLIELVASKGVRVEVVAFHQSMASELRAVCDEYIDLNDHLAELRAK